MRSISCILVIYLSIFSCKEKQTTSPPKEELSNEWISYKAKKDSRSKSIVLVSGDEEYRSEEMLPELARILSEHHGFDTRVLFAQAPDKPGIINPNNVNNIPGLGSLKEADLMILFTRFRDLPDVQMRHIENYLEEGKPILAIRTATHAFHVKDSLATYAHWGNYYEGEKIDWHGGFGQKILGSNWLSHWGHHKHQSTRGYPVEEALIHPILQNIEVSNIWGPTDVYEAPRKGAAKDNAILLGAVIDRVGDFAEQDLFFGMNSNDHKMATNNTGSNKRYDPNNPMMPILWENTYQIKDGKKGKAVCSTMGSSTDFLNEEFRKLMVQSSYYLLELSNPSTTEVTLSRTYSPNQYGFHTNEYWEKQDLKISRIKEKEKN